MSDNNFLLDLNNKKLLVKKPLSDDFNLDRSSQKRDRKKLKNLKVPLAGKTGTTNNNYDAWFIGYNSS